MYHKINTNWVTWFQLRTLPPIWIHFKQGRLEAWVVGYTLRQVVWEILCWLSLPVSPWMSLPGSIRNWQSKVRYRRFNVDASVSKKYALPCKMSVDPKLSCGGNLAARYQLNENQEKALKPQLLCRGSYQSCPISEFGTQVSLSPKNGGYMGVWYTLCFMGV